MKITCCVTGLMWLAQGLVAAWGTTANVAPAVGYCRSVNLVADAGSSSAVQFTTYSSDPGFPLSQVVGGSIFFSRELRPRQSVPGDYEADYVEYRVPTGNGYLDYGSFVVSLPTTDSDNNGLPDFCQQNMGVSAAGTGTLARDWPSVGSATFNSTFNRAAGNPQGTFSVSSTTPGFTFSFGGKWNVFSLTGTLAYTRGTVNQGNLTFTMTDPYGQTHSYAGETCYLSVDSPEQLTFSGGGYNGWFEATGINGTTGTIAVGRAIVFHRQGNKYIGIMSLSDGYPATSWSDYCDWVIEVTDPNDANHDGLPDLTDPTAGASDLYVQNITQTSPAYAPGAMLNCDVTIIKTMGTAVTLDAAFRNALVLSQNRVWNAAANVVLEVVPLSSSVVLDTASNSYTFHLQGRVPTTAAPGNYYLGVTIDSTNAVPELNEANNGWWSVASDTVICAYLVQPSGWAVAPAGGSTNVTVTSSAGCGWTVSNTAPTWLTATPATGAGNSTVNLSASPNLSGVPRAGIITIAGQTVQVTQTSGLLAFHSAPGYLPGSTVTVSCTLVATGAPNSVAWHATLPSGWTYLSGTGEGTQKPTAGSSGVLDWSWNPVPPNPVAFTCTLQVPAGQSGPKTLAAAVAYRWNGVANPVTNNALPDPLVIPEILYHTADYRTPFWQMDGTEVNRVLSYWRAGGYHRDPVGVDGFAPGPGATNGARHAADFREASWMIDGTEVNRVLSYWRAGGYHRDTNGVDGYAPGAP